MSLPRFRVRWVQTATQPSPAHDSALLTWDSSYGVKPNRDPQWQKSDDRAKRLLSSLRYGARRSPYLASLSAAGGAAHDGNRYCTSAFTSPRAAPYTPASCASPAARQRSNHDGHDGDPVGAEVESQDSGRTLPP